MFAQVIIGKAKDADGLKTQLDKWMQELRPGATGFLGATGGVAEDGTVALVARFQSVAAARANENRPEQGDWWQATAVHLDGEPDFIDCEEVETQRGGGSDQAGFVQIVRGRVNDLDRMRILDAEFDRLAGEMRPDFMGGLTAVSGNEVCQVAYFTSEAEARKGEAQEPPAELQAVFEEWQALWQDLRYVDLKDPWLY